MASRHEIADLLQVLHALYPHTSPIPKGLTRAEWKSLSRRNTSKQHLPP
jgi:hypothetical protein